MPRVYVSSVIEAPVARVWERVRDFNGLPRWLRISVGLPSENEAFLRALRSALA